jgi:hypothetical protein
MHAKCLQKQIGVILSFEAPFSFPQLLRIHSIRRLETSCYRVPPSFSLSIIIEFSHESYLFCLLSIHLELILCIHSRCELIFPSFHYLSINHFISISYQKPPEKEKLKQITALSRGLHEIRGNVQKFPVPSKPGSISDPDSNPATTPGTNPGKDGKALPWYPTPLKYIQWLAGYIGK